MTPENLSTLNLTGRENLHSRMANCQYHPNPKTFGFRFFSMFCVVSMVERVFIIKKPQVFK